MDTDKKHERLDDIASKLVEIEEVNEVKVYAGRGDIEVKLDIPNTSWGLPNAVQNQLRQMDAHIDDFSHMDIADASVRLYVVPTGGFNETSRGGADVGR